MFIILGMVMVMSWCVDVIERFTRWRFDLHGKPHMMNRPGGRGCFCTCKECIQCRDCRNDVFHTLCFFYCICRRCNEECTSLARLGSAHSVYEEQLAGLPTGGRKGRAWYRQ